jgi:hypothetical protein
VVAADCTEEAVECDVDRVTRSRERDDPPLLVATVSQLGQTPLVRERDGLRLLALRSVDAVGVAVLALRGEQAGRVVGSTAFASLAHDSECTSESRFNHWVVTPPCPPPAIRRSALASTVASGAQPWALLSAALTSPGVSAPCDAGRHACTTRRTAREWMSMPWAWAIAADS